MEKQTLKERTANGLLWGVINSGTTQVLNLVIGIFLARVLSPEEYGIIGVLTIFTTIAGDLQNSGFASALINIRQPRKKDYDSVFSFNVYVSLVLYVALFFSAPFIADFFHQDCLTSVSRFVFLGFLLGSFGIAPGAYLTKNMMNREIAIIGLVSLIMSGVIGVLMAVLGFSYWALAFQQVIYILMTTLGRFYYAKGWHPGFTLDFGPIKAMWRFSVKILVTTIFNDLSTNILTVIFGRLFPLRSVGNYTQAFKWNTMANSLVSNAISQIAQPVFVESAYSESGGNVKDRELQVFRKMFRFTCFVSMPLMFGLSLVSDEFIMITIGYNWKDCVPLLRIFCISGAFMPLYINYRHLAMSLGRSDIYMWLNIGQIVALIVLVFFCHAYGIYIMVCAYTVLTISWLLPWHLWSGSLIQYGFVDMLKDMLPFALASSIVMAVTYSITSLFENIYLLIFLRIILAALLYYAVMNVARVQILKECEQFLLKRIKKQTKHSGE